MKKIIALFVFVFSSFYVISNDKLPDKVSNLSHTEYGIDDAFLIKFSHISSSRTFNEEFNNISIVSVKNSLIANNKHLVSEVTYSTPKGLSTYTIVTNIALGGKIIVDCKGGCDCREKLVGKPDGSYTVECTCADCTMTVEQSSS